MIPVDEARGRILAELKPVGIEEVPLLEAQGRVLAEDVRARLTQPPWPVSAMDGYAVRAADVTKVPVTLTIAGAVPAGSSYGAPVKAGEAVRIFTGAPVPDGADAIVIQEDTEASGGKVTVKESSAVGRHIRVAGLDFKAGEVGVAAGHRLTARDVGLTAAMNVPWLRVRRRPRIAILATGDEIARPGDPVGPNQIVSSNSYALAALVRALGAEPVVLGIAKDTVEDTVAKVEGARGSDLLVTTGGASVGDHDLVQKALATRGLAVDFWKIAMRPGKPLMWGKLGDLPVLGLPGNPVSTIVCALIFLKPAIEKLSGLDPEATSLVEARLGADLAANDHRQDYLRSTLSQSSGALTATPFSKQDSSMLSLLSKSDGLIVRPPKDPAKKAGEPVRVLPFASAIPAI
ncbi:MAG: molybdopterin molybdotransferase MoeA [Rhodospirillaceae bacterium]|nr:molybdopterin molybdotransferase MoeA [Rhodospirillaceae bacterium]